eukprot:731516-Rhodomonas_salina.5
MAARPRGSMLRAVHTTRLHPISTSRHHPTSPTFSASEAAEEWGGRVGLETSEAGDEGHVQEEPEDPGAGVEGGGRALDEDAEEGPERSRPADQDSGPCRARERQPRQEKQRAHRRLQPPGHPPVVPGSALQSRERSEQEDQQCGREHGCEGLGGSVRVPLKAVDGQGGKAGEERDMQGGGHTARREKDLGDRALERERGRRALARLHVA